MTDEQIKKQLKIFQNEVFKGCKTIEAAIRLKDKMDMFCKENNVTADQLREFAESGAGEMLYMLTS